MITSLFAFAYPGECARFMVAHPDLATYAPLAAIASLLLVGALVYLLFRSRLASTASMLLLFCMPAFRLGVQHPLKRSLLLFGALFAAFVVIGLFRMVRGWKRKDEKDQHALARLIVFLGLSVFTLAALAFMRSLNVYWAALASVVAGISLSYWWRTAKEKLVSKISFWLLSFVLAFSCVFELCVADWRDGEFADRMAAAIIADMGDRDWIVTDGSLDDHLRLVAAEQGREIQIISLTRDEDVEYRKSLASLVRERQLAGAASEELAMSLDLGVLQFVQDWFRADPEATRKCVVFGAPDLWYSAGVRPVPEMFFFGGDPARKPDWSRWAEFSRLLHAPQGWGSYRIWQENDPVSMLRHNLRRHLGLIANDRGVWLQDQGENDEAYRMYRLTVDEIDRDNISAMFNILAMASVKYDKAVSGSKDIEERMKKIVEDKNRRYMLGALSRFYGYVRDPQLFVRLGFLWARSGMPGTAMAQIRRAIDLVPSDRRRTLINMLASLYADNNERTQSRRAYESVLKSDASNHEALIGMMRLSLLEGDQQKAMEYLERAVAAGGDDPRVDIERAMVAMMKNDLETAAKILRRCVDANKGDLRSLALLASVTMQRSDIEKDPARKAVLEKELESTLLPQLEAGANNAGDYYVNTVKAFLLLRKGKDRRREARDAFAVAAKARPDISATQDIVLGLDISLNDTVAAELHARDSLKLNRNAPLANYAMGSIALGRDDLKLAELYLKRAAEAEKPVDLALNDLAEVYRRMSRPAEALKYAEKAVEMSPKLYVARATLASVLMDLNQDLPRALKLMNDAIELSKVDGRVEDVRMYVGLARAQFLNGSPKEAKVSLRKMKSQADKLVGFELQEYQEILKSVQ